MRILSLDTTGPYCTVALCDTAKVLAYKTENIGRGHAERLAPMAAEVLTCAGLISTDVDKLVVCSGPGSFTGTRVAMAFAKGFALPRKLPVVGISALEVRAAHYDPEGRKKIVCVADVRRSELCWSATFKGKLIQAPITQPAEEARRAIAKLSPDIVVEDGIIDGRVLAWLGADLSSDQYPAQPLYSRGPDAKLPGGKLPGSIVPGSIPPK